MLPEKFTERMKSMLGGEFAEFDKALSEPNVHGVRVNEKKVSIEHFMEIFDGKLTKIPYTSDGFIPERQESLGSLPEHHAGMFYSQDPGAMSAVSALELKRGDRVLDACAAPGGKSLQISAAIGDSGFLLSNEYIPKRAKIIVSNFERLGISNAIVTSLDTADFPKMFNSFFDAVVCDAPCSGEGMFRKCEAALEDWSEENVMMCRERQLEILSNCAGAVRPGGKLLYSTCTYSIEENEGVVVSFLSSHPDFYIEKAGDAIVSATADGIRFSPEAPEDIKHTRRFYPHLSQGEGQYIALLKKRESLNYLPTILYKDGAKEATKQERLIIESFLKDNFKVAPRGRIVKCGEGFSLITHDIPVPQHSVFMTGVMLGEIRSNNFFPHHHLISAFGRDMKRVENIICCDERITRYLRGEEIFAKDIKETGWCAVCYEGAAVGVGKCSSGVIKNHYPKGLRLK